MKYRQRSMLDVEDGKKDLFPAQKLVRDYLLIETPYRGLLLFHGLGSGKTCASIAVAESLMSNKKVYVLTPASLRENFLKEIRKCGDPIYVEDQHWVEKKANTDEEREKAFKMGISEKFINEEGRYFITVPDMPSNFKNNPELQGVIKKQISDIIESRFNFINFNGLSSANIDKVLSEEHMFDNSVIIIDEAHNLISGVVNDREIKRRLYDMIYNAVDAKVVCLTGTPVVNRPQEISFLMNLLRGPVKQLSIPTKSAVSWDESMMTAFFRSVKDIDTIEYNSVKRVFYLTRNPPHFESVYNEKGERIAVKYNKDFAFEPDMKKWVSSWKTEFLTKFGGVELESEEKMVETNLECLPTDFDEFYKTFIDGLKIKNALLMGRRIQGLVSYYKGANENLLPKRLDEEKTLVKIDMSETQFNRYLTVRSEEIRSESNKKRKGGLNDEMGSYRMISRMACNYAVPAEFRPSKWDRNEDEDDDGEGKIDIVKKLLEDPDKYLSKTGLKQYSPKMLRILEDIEANIGEKDKWKNQFIYSQYLTAEGLGIFSEVLKLHGFQEYKLIKEGGVWKEDPAMDPEKPAFGLFTGGKSGIDKERRELVRQIFGDDYGGTFPQLLKESVEKGKKRLCIFMASSAGAEGIDLKKVRNVYIMEPYWTPGRIEQVIGRAIRIGSHIGLPDEADRNVTVKLYMTVFNKDQTIVAEGANIVMVRRADMVLKRYEGDEPKEVFMSTDEFLYETAFEKNRIIKSIATVLKQSAIDCEIHRNLHTKNEPTIQCMRFDTSVTSEDLAYRPKYLSDEKDTLYTKNLVKRGRMLQRISVKGIFMIMDTVSREIFDHGAFEDNNRLIQIGELVGTNKIKFFPHVVL
jgi:hypothetical protein